MKDKGPLQRAPIPLLATEGLLLLKTTTRALAVPSSQRFTGQGCIGFFFTNQFEHFSLICHTQSTPPLHHFCCYTVFGSAWITSLCIPFNCVCPFSQLKTPRSYSQNTLFQKAVSAVSEVTLLLISQAQPIQGQKCYILFHLTLLKSIYLRDFFIWLSLFFPTLLKGLITDKVTVWILPIQQNI